MAGLHCHQAGRLDPAGRLMHWLGVAVLLLLTPHAVLLMTAALHCVAARCCCCSAVAVAPSPTHCPKTTPAHAGHVSGASGERSMPNIAGAQSGFNPKARALVPFRSSSIPILLEVQGHPLAQTDRTQKEDEVTAQNNLLFFTN